ncbi:MAG: HAD family phosphatase [Proteobacteria bacterium]|nr:HAD family phosphatase [Pseudomonadota bacterium]
MPFKALVFDFDGIITDTEPVHMEAWQGVLEPLGVFIEEDEFHRYYVGLNDRDFLDAVAKAHRHHFEEIEKADLIESKSAATISMLMKEIPLLPGVGKFIDSVRDKCPLAICSGANRGEIEYILKHLKWHGYFDPIIASDSVKKGKPDPEGYIRAYEGLVEKIDAPVMAGEVIAIEDSPRGIAAAKAAGLRCIAVSNSYERDLLKSADWIVDSLGEVDLRSL